MENLQQDITAVKEVLHSRIGAMESGLEGLELAQQKLTAELHAIRVAIMDEMLTTLQLSTSSRLNSPLVR